MFTRLFVLLFLFWGCSKQKQNLPFDFENPVEVTKLPEKLHEISGIALYNDREVACVQDEKGIIYFYDIKKDKLRSSVQFGNDKDYEAIANVHDTLYVLASNGIIYEVDSSNAQGYSNRYLTFLSKINNCEGLCFDEGKHRLLVACKGKPEKGTAKKGAKAIYSFDLETKTLNKVPAYSIFRDSVQNHLEEKKSFFSGLFGSSEKTIFEFEPSDIGIDPVTSDVYVLSSVGKTLLALTQSGEIKFAVHLDPVLFKQPEGITFAKDGTMLISDEGRKGKANLVRLKRMTSEL